MIFSNFSSKLFWFADRINFNFFSWHFNSVKVLKQTSWWSIFDHISNMTSNSVYLVFSLACLIFYFYGAYVTFNSINNGKNDCRMTFMFEHPNYVVSCATVIRREQQINLQKFSAFSFPIYQTCRCEDSHKKPF